MANSADPDQLASTLLARTEYIRGLQLVLLARNLSLNSEAAPNRWHVYITKTRLCKYKENLQKLNPDFFYISAQNIDFGYSLETASGGSNKYPKSMFWAKLRK